jgi:hypothetical protein
MKPPKALVASLNANATSDLTAGGGAVAGQAYIPFS